MSRAIVPDSNTFSRLLRDEERTRTRFVEALAASSTIIVSVIVYYELRRGLLKSGARAALNYLDRLIAPARIVDLNRADSEEAARLWAHTHSIGLAREDADILIAAQANTRGATVATANVDHFEGMADRLEAWT